MIVPLILELRKRRVPVGLQEIVALAHALAGGLHESSLEQYYYVARALLIHDESRLDDFDQVFGFLYKGVPFAAKQLTDELFEWLQNPRDRPELTDEEKAGLKNLDLDELKRMYEERLREQTGRHDGGGHWIGTGGRSPFGTNGFHPSGISLRSGPQTNPGGGRSILRTADARRYRGYRNDLILDVRQLEVALRKLRSFDRDGCLSELDLDKTVDATARNFGDLELVLRKPRRPNTRVILMMDAGGSMDPFATLVSQLFSAAKRATHWKELRTYYFHNCVYGRLYRTDGLSDAVLVRDLLRECDARYKLIFVGDASMAPYELLGDAWSTTEEDRVSGLQWLVTLRRHFTDSIWLNPDQSPLWEGSTTETIARIFPMFGLTISGLEEGLAYLKKSRGQSR
ncbi:MAG: VWA domain-containing protein [Deltaproteobacteria bacterium]|nr:VWA domain-containing protein [Deltaproteobacteria bacterium]